MQENLMTSYLKCYSGNFLEFLDTFITSAHPWALPFFFLFFGCLLSSFILQAHTPHPFLFSAVYLWKTQAT